MPRKTRVRAHTRKTNTKTATGHKVPSRTSVREHERMVKVDPRERHLLEDPIEPQEELTPNPYLDELADDYNEEVAELLSEGIDADEAYDIAADMLDERIAEDQPSLKPKQRQALNDRVRNHSPSRESWELQDAMLPKQLTMSSLKDVMRERSLSDYDKTVQRHTRGGSKL